MAPVFVLQTDDLLLLNALLPSKDVLGHQPSDSAHHGFNGGLGSLECRLICSQQTICVGKRIKNQKVVPQSSSALRSSKVLACGLTNSLGITAEEAAVLRLLLLHAALHAAEGSVHALNEAVLHVLVVLLHLQVNRRVSRHVSHPWLTETIQMDATRQLPTHGRFGSAV